MEDNISNALLMAGAMLVFIVAVSLTFSLISQTKSTADTVLYSYDDTQYYDQGYENITYTLANEDDRNRAVDMETIMPTVYRYIKEHYGVTIMNKDGEILARFDATTESIVNDWENCLKYESRDGKCQKHYDYIKNLAIAVGLESEFTSNYGDYNSLKSLWEEIYQLDKKGISGYEQIKYGTPWLQDPSRGVAKRLDADFGGGDIKYESSGIHTGLDLLNKYAKKDFKEYYLFVSEDDSTITDEDTGDSVTIKSSTNKLEIIYVMEG